MLFELSSSISVLCVSCIFALLLSSRNEEFLVQFCYSPVYTHIMNDPSSSEPFHRIFRSTVSINMLECTLFGFVSWLCFMRVTDHSHFRTPIVTRAICSDF